MSSNLINYLGKNSYPSIVNQIVEKLNDAQNTANSLVGKELLQKTISVLNESVTPMTDLKEFTTNAEILAKTDATFSDILNFISKEVKSGDLNFLVHMAKEEHFKNMSRAGFPDVKSTIKDIEEHFGEPSSIIEQAIKNGIFDKLQSNLMMDLKSSLVDDGKTKLVDPNDVVKINENSTLINDNLIQYSPIGIKMEDSKNNRTLLLTESDVLSFDRVENTFNRLATEEILSLQIPDSHKKMMSAIQELVYNPINNTFKLDGKDWDITPILTATGDILLKNDENEIQVDKKELPDLLLESINLYSQKIPNFDRNKYLKDADNFIMLVENHSKMILIDELKVIRNLNENNKYVIIEPNSQKTPKLIGGTGLSTSQLFESYVNLNNKCNDILGYKLTGLFESQLEQEKQFTSEKFETLQDLRQKQQELNQTINEVKTTLQIAEEGSPAYEKLNENLKNLDVDLESNIEKINYYQNNHKLYQ